MADQRRINAHWFYATLVAGMLFTGPARAAVINYSETINGDLPVFATDSPIFNLDVGTNTFTGETTFSNNSIFGSDFDSFSFNILTGTRLESILIDISLLSVGSGIFSTVNYELQNSSFNLIESEFISIPSANISLFASNLPLGSGQFALQNAGLGGALEPGDFRTAAYTISLNVVKAVPTPVPEPTFVFSLLALGAFGVGSMSKRYLSTR